MDRASHNNISDKTIEKSTTNNTKTWAEVTTINVLPGEEVLIDIENNDATKELQKGEKKISLSSHVDPSGKTAVLLTSSNLGNDVSPEVQPPLEFTDIKEAKYFKKGWWSIDEAGKKPITRAVSGMFVYFHIETNIPDNPDEEQEKVYVELYEDNEQQVSSATKKPSITAIELIDKLVIPVRLDNIKRGLRNEPDKELKLYFNCTYNEETVKLPADSNNYLMVASLIIDRYKMPGLNASGTDIADDLTYGYGNPIPNKKTVYTKSQIKQFSKDYQETGFNEEKHGLFTNKEDLPRVIPILQPPQEDEETIDYHKALLEKEYPLQKMDKKYTNNPSPEDIYWQQKYAADQANKNNKAIYSKKQMYSTYASFYYNSGQDIKMYNEGNEGGPYFDKLGNLLPCGKKKDNTKLFYIFRKVAKDYLSTIGELQLNIDRMISKFESNKGGIYEDPILTKHIVADPATDRYCMYIENYMAEKIKQETFENVLKIEDREPDFDASIKANKTKRRNKQKIKSIDINDDIDNSTTIFKKPSYSFSLTPKGIAKARQGLTIATNDIWAVDVILKELKNDGENYSCKYQVTLWDHFGLDLPDMQKDFNLIPYVKEIFISWFVLQHLRGFKPFVTKITFEKEFKGNINEGREDRLKKNKEKQKALIAAEKEKQEEIEARLKRYRKKQKPSWEHNGKEPWHRNY